MDRGCQFAILLLICLINCEKGLTQCVEDSICWCTISDAEQTKCNAMKQAFAGASLSKTISCRQASNHAECMQLIKDGQADVVTLDGGDAHTAGKDYGLVPVAGEVYSTDLGDASYYAVAVVKKNSTFTINELEGKKSCHTGIAKTSGWNVPIGYLVEEDHITYNKQNCDLAVQVGGFFNQSCVPGAQLDKYDPNNENPDNLCALCTGSGDDNCARSSAEPYYDYSGAFRCLVDGAGDVAFVKHTTVDDNRAADVEPADYELLCRDGTRKATTQWESCNLARVPSHVVMTNSNNNDRAALWSFLNEAQQQFGTSSNPFKMFESASHGGKDLLFKDSTRQLVDAGNKNTYQKWLGDDYLEAIEAIECENGGGRAILSPVLMALTFLIVLKSLLL